MSREHDYTGILRDVRRCYMDDSRISFLFGYVVEYESSKFNPGDWFASSYIRDVKTIDGRYFFYTANSVYVTDSSVSIIVPDACLDNIRMGTPPEIAARGIQSMISLP
jgi:hypothetical protein